jgi:uncharacterized phage infection (PIP) family protein YhgE
MTDQVKQQVSEIATAAEEQAQGIQQLNEAVSQMDQIAQGAVQAADVTTPKGPKSARRPAPQQHRTGCQKPCLPGSPRAELTFEAIRR